jgi:hypothetical protein
MNCEKTRIFKQTVIVCLTIVTSGLSEQTEKERLGYSSIRWMQVHKSTPQSTPHGQDIQLITTNQSDSVVKVKNRHALTHTRAHTQPDSTDAPEQLNENTKLFEIQYPSFVLTFRNRASYI